MISVVNPYRMDYLEALNVVQEILNMLAPHCERIEIAGSIRRRESFIGDIEILCLPKTVIHILPEPEAKKVERPEMTLFEVAIAEAAEKDLQDVLKIFPKQKILPVKSFSDLVDSWKKVKGEPSGRYTQRMLPNGCTLDLFMPTRSDYYRQLAIRTGSKDYSQFVIARSWKRKGWCGTEDGLRLISECQQKNKTWKCIVDKPTLPPEWQSEKEFFAFIGLTYMSPQFRTVNGYEKTYTHKKYK